MALPAGRYGVTKNQLLKIKKLPMNTIKLIEELTEKFDLLGTAAFKNSTSVVTQSTDLVESGAVYDALGFGTKNLFDKNAGNILNGFINNTTGEIVANNDTRVIYCPCEPNTTYTISKISTSRFFVGWTNTKPTAGVVANDVIVGYGETYITITTGSTATYIVAFVWRAESDTGITVQSVLDSVQIEKGSTATSFEPYHAPVSEFVPQVVSDAVGWDYTEQIDYSNYVDRSNTSHALTATGIRIYSTSNGTYRGGFLYIPNYPKKDTLRLITDIVVASGRGYIGFFGSNNNSDWTTIAEINSTTVDTNVNLIIPPSNYVYYRIAFNCTMGTSSAGDVTFNNVSLKHDNVDEQKCDNSVIGTVEGANASKAWSVGEHFINGGQFKEVTNSIASGEAINSGNTKNKPIADCLYIHKKYVDSDITIPANNMRIFDFPAIAGYTPIVCTTGMSTGEYVLIPNIRYDISTGALTGMRVTNISDSAVTTTLSYNVLYAKI